MDTFSAGFRPALDQVALQQQQSQMLDLPGKLPAMSTYIDPTQMTQPTGSNYPMPQNNLPLNELGLGLKNAAGEGGGGGNVFMQPQSGGWSAMGGNSELQEAQLKMMEQQQDVTQFGSATSGAIAGAKLGSMVMPGIGTAVGGLLGAVGGWIFGND